MQLKSGLTTELERTRKQKGNIITQNSSLAILWFINCKDIGEKV